MSTHAVEQLDRTRLLQCADDLRETVLDDALKGVPLGARVLLGEVDQQNWNVARGDLALPVTTLHARAMNANLATMEAYCERNNALLAPHGKTTMSPQLFALQASHGAWAFTAATPTQVAVMRRYGVQRIILANELVDAPALRWVTAEIASDSSFDFYCLVDDADTVRAMSDTIADSGHGVTLNVLLEVGVPGGRCGVRDLDSALEVAAAVAATEHLRLVGVEAYEGLVTGGMTPEDLHALDTFFAGVRSIVLELARRDLFDANRIIVTAGGSSYFDRVVAGLGSWDGVRDDVDLVLRSGCYISHDAGKYEKLSPLAGRRAEQEPLRLHNALTAWASVLSRPEPDLAILSIGKRDAAHDLTLPQPRELFRADGSRQRLREAETFKLMDQHAFVRVAPGLAIAPGDIVAFDMSHPCTAFDKLPFIPIIDDDFNVVDGVLTFF
ncbi:alanine racemase [Saccharopolyspora spinosa]|uniref:D-serine dehydratase n=1 Tax=Saccharopolyspora spinosa TaxID=60894 RepID=A0A2N3Y6D5_SACSN|nr:alanine racemase [Saccharopolyspora spinosa]PKW18502.1 D-serine dehydratase [Saccharopolyspora spinosa]